MAFTIAAMGSAGSFASPNWRALTGQISTQAGFCPPVDAVVAPRALVGDTGRVRRGVLAGRGEVPGAVGARCDAVATADTPASVHKDDAVLGCVGGADRADPNARRLRALHAEAGLEVGGLDRFAGGARRRGVLREAVDAVIRRVDVQGPIRCGHVTLNPRPRELGGLRHVVLFLARHNAETAADAGRAVHHKRPGLGGRVVVGDDRGDLVARAGEDWEVLGQHARANDPARDGEAKA